VTVNIVSKVVSRCYRVSLCMAIAAILFNSLPAIGAPYGPDGKSVSYRQPDGTTVKVRVFGDEFYAVAETEEGYTVVYDKNKVLTFGTLSADGKQILSTGIRASNKPDHATLQASGIKKNTRLSPEGREESVARGLQRMRADSKGRINQKSIQYYEAALSSRAASFSSDPGLVSPSETVIPPPVYAPPTVTRIGEYVGLCLLVDFSDQAGTIAKSVVDDYCNKPGYTGYSNAGSIYDYFLKQSGGRLRYNNIVTAYVRVPNPKTYYDDGSDLPWGSSKAQQLVIDALDVLIAQGFDFTPLSRDAGGTIYSMNVFYAGTCASGWSTGLWPSSWAIPTKSVDAANGIKASSYQMTDMGTALDIGTFCHENGHMLMDYPDLYSYNGNAANMGSYTLMAGGNSADGGRHPTNIDPYLKTASGWADIVDLSSNSLQRCTVQVDANLFYRYRNPAKTTEYFIFEVRDNTGYEGPFGGSAASVNPTAGLVAYHAYETGSNPYSSIFTASNPACSYTQPYELLLVEANPNGTKTPWYDDPTPGADDSFKSSGTNYISDTTTPNLKFWVPLATSSGGGRNTASGCVITNISADGPIMSFVVGAGALTNAPSIVLSRSTIDSFCDFGTTAVTQTLSIANGGGGTLSYSITDNQSWLTCSPTNGTATTESDTITLTFSTSVLPAGSYSAMITVMDPAASPTNKTITVNLTVHSQAVMALTPSAISTNGVSRMPGTQVPLAIRNTGGGAMTYSLSKTQSWLALSHTSGTVIAETDTVYVNLNSAVLAAGTYNDTITITSPEASNSPQSVPVTFTLSHVNMLVASPNGGEVLYSNGSTNINWISSLGGNVSIELLKGGVFDSQITASTTNDASYAWTVPLGKNGTNYTIRITSLSPSPVYSDESDVFFSIMQPVMSLSTTNIVENGLSGSVGPQVELRINNTSGGVMTYSLSKTQSWLTLSPTSGTVSTETDTIFVNLNATTLAAGTYNDTITITSPEASNSPQTIAVSFLVNGDDIVITSPNGGETFITGVQTNITWVSGIGGNVSIHLLKNGSLDSVIVSSTANDGNYTWNVPESKSGSAFRVRVTSLDINPGFYDDSNADFAIQWPPLLSQNFEASLSLPSGWSQTQISGSTTWKIQKGGSTAGGGNPSTAHSGTNNATLVDGTGADDKARLVTPVFNAYSYTNVTLKFWHTQVLWSPDQDFLNVFYSTNGGSAWMWIAGYSNDVSAWTERTLSLPSVSTNTRVAFEGNAKYGYGVCIDDVMVTGEESGGSGVIVTKSGGSVDVTEGGATDTYTVVLGSAPSASVVITITPDTEVSVNVSNLTFTTGNWASPQTVTVTAINDSDHEFSHIGMITHAATSGDAAFNGILIDDVLVSITDNDNNAPVVSAGDDQTVLLTGGTWSPTEVSPSLWLDADDVATVQLNGTTVSNWLDKSGNSRNATQSTPANQPTDTAAGLDGKHVLRFDGASDFFNINLDFLAGVSHSAFIVTKPTTYNNIYGAATSGSGASSLHVGFISAASYRMNYWGNDWNGAITANFHAGAGNILNYVWITGAAKQIFANGSSEGTSGVLAGTIGTMAGGGRISNVTGHGYYGGDIAEMIMVTGTVSVATRETVEGYLAHKWGIEGYLPAGHTYKTEGPSSAAAAATLDGSASDTDALSTLWTVVTGPGPVVFDNANAVDTVANFMAEGVYTLRLSASDTVTQVVDEVVITVTTNTLPPAIMAPTGLVAVAVATNRIDLTWSDNSTNETGFVIERSMTNGAGFAVITTTAANATNVADIGLSVGRTYYYRIFATNAITASVTTPQVSATTPKIQASVTLSGLSQAYNGTARSVGVATVPPGLTVALTYAGSPAAPTNAGNYAVVATINEASYEGSTNGTLVVNQATPTVSAWPVAAVITEGQAVSNATLSGGSASVSGSFIYNSPSTVPPLGTNAINVTFWPDNGNYASVSGSVAVTVNEAPPLAPTGVGVTPRVGQVDLVWSAVANATGYNVRRSTVPGGSYVLVGTPSGTSFSDTTVTNGQTYYYVVSAMGNGGEGADSAEVEVRLLQALPFSETFDGAGMASTPGMLNGQRGWNGGSTTLVQAGVGRGGSIGLSLAEDGAVQDFANGTNTVTVDFWCKPVPGAEPTPATIPSNATAVIWVDTGNYVTVYSNATVVTLPVLVISNDWNHIEAVVDYAGGSWGLTVNGTNVASGLGLYSPQSQFSGIEISNTSAQSAYFDDFNIAGTAAPLTPYESWLVDYFSTTSVDDSALSSNGVNTIREAYIAGLNPTNPAGLFAISGVGAQSGSMVLSWNSVSGRFYNVYWSSNLLGGAGSFQLLYSNIPWNAGSVTDTVHSAQDKGFYRIDVQLE